MKEGEGIVIDVRKYSNTSLIVKIFSREGGKIGGFIKGGNSPAKHLVSVSSLVSFKISKRLEEHLGMLKIETVKSFAMLNLKNRFKTFVINSVREILFFLMQDGNPEPEVYDISLDLLYFIEHSESEDEILVKYVKFELKLLSLLGFGLDFERCALTGVKEDLFFISPITGKCASFEAGNEFRGKLFEIPSIYGNKNSSSESLKADLKNALEINSHFLSKLPNFEKITSRKMFTFE
jgi:DNA repair protein RecO (recombination protein O)